MWSYKLDLGIFITAIMALATAREKGKRLLILKIFKQYTKLLLRDYAMVLNEK